MPRKPLTPENKAAMKAGRDLYFANRRAAKEAALVQPAQEAPKAKRKYVRKVTAVQAAPVHNETEHRGRPTRPVIETTIKKPYTFATVSTKVGGKVITEHGFAKWDNVAPAWSEDLGKQIAIGRAAKEMSKKHGIKIKI